MTSGETISTASADPRALARTVWRWRFLLLAFIVIIPLATYLYESSRPKVYRASVLAAVTAGQQLGLTSLLNNGPSAPSATDLQADAQLVTTIGVAEQAAKYLHPTPSNVRALLAQVSATADQNTNFITISAKASDPYRAAAIANAFARALAANQAQVAANNLNAAIAKLQREVQALPKGSKARAQLSAQIVKYRVLQASQGADIVTVNPATARTTPTSPRVARSVVLALIAALLAGLGAVAIAETVDRRIRHPDDVGDAAQLPLLSAIPESAFLPTANTHVIHESFVTLRASLTYFNVDRRMSSILVTSPGKEDGKTTTSVSLAKALARAGKDVILVDADLRRPAIADRLSIPTNQGLVQVLIAEIPLEEALWQGRPRLKTGTGGRLRVLPAGRPPPNPSELLGSRRMQDLLGELTDRCDLVLIDSTPLLTVADSMPLLRTVSGVVLVARVNRTSRESISRLRFVVDSAGGHAIGVVATGAKRGGLYVAPGYGYETAYATAHPGSANGAVARGRRWRLRLGRSRDAAEKMVVRDDA